ncbi:MAG: glycoside hydrolase family 99-like domain-containing protein [Planctomycetota bacterium]
MRVAAFVYPGWHPIPERDASFHPGFTEWELVRSCAPRFDGHVQPRLPALGEYDDRDPEAVGARIALALRHGIDAFVYGLFWCRGKRVFESALDEGFLGSEVGRRAPFAVMWANRMPRRVLPVRRADLPVIDPARRAPSDVEDFVALVDLVARSYFARPNYLTVGGAPYLSIFDSTFFVRELGPDDARRAIEAGKRRARDLGFEGIHLAAIDPNADLAPIARDLGFDSVTHYVLLPEWKGPSLQDYAEMAALRASQWPDFGRRTGLPYMPSVSPGWDASPRAADFGAARPDRYPWSPVVTGESPARFRDALARAAAFPAQCDDGLTFVASLNEWSEGHYLEPDVRHGTGWLEAVRDARR